jgi:soluble lytic murein transglycosylase-like protein
MTTRVFPVLVFLAASCWASTPAAQDRVEAEYYVAAYARHYGVPLNFVRSIVEQESGWHSCAVSPKGAVGLMQIMPDTARWLGIKDRCNIKENVSGGIRYLAWLIRKFHGDLRLVAASYYAGERVISKRGLKYANPDVVAYVVQVQANYQSQPTWEPQKSPSQRRRTTTQ